MNLWGGNPGGITTSWGSLTAQSSRKDNTMSDQLPSSPAGEETSAHPVRVPEGITREWAKLLYAPDRNPIWPSEDSLPHESVVRSYGTQWYRLDIQGEHFALRPQLAQDAPFNEHWPALDPVPLSVARALRGYIIGYCHPHGIPNRVGETAELKDKALGLVRELGARAIEVVALQRESQWVEPMLLVPGITSEAAREMAVKLGQPVVVAVGEDRISVVQADGTPREGGYAWKLVPLLQAPCPMSLLCDGNEAPKREGGPWVSRSMAVAGMWQLHQSYSHSLLACKPCGDSVPEPGRAIMLSEWIPASRYKYTHSVDESKKQKKILRRFDVAKPTAFTPVSRDV